VTAWIFVSAEQRDGRLALLKCTPCPHCKHAGALNRHGFLTGYDEQNFKQKVVRAIRVFCSNRGKARGCGRTFSVWIAEKIKRLFLDAQSLWRFLQQAAATGNKYQAFHKLQSSMSQSAIYRTWNRFRKAQSKIRTTLAAICPPPRQFPPNEPAENDDRGAAHATLAHLKEAFKASALNPIAAYQVLTQSFFI